MSVIAELSKRFPQLCIKPEKGVSQSELYRSIVRRGGQYSGDLSHFIGSEEDRLTVEKTPAGKVEAVFLKNREDFECFYQIMAEKCEPVPVLRSVGASYIGGINDWSKIHTHLAEYERNGGSDSDSEFRRFTANKENYKTSIILLSDCFYSNISFEETPYDSEEWRKISLDIRKYHELTHFVCRNLFPEKIVPIWDELLADFYGLLCAVGSYDKAFALSFLGIRDEKYIGGRMEQYVKGQISDALVDEIAELAGWFEKLAPKKFSREEDNFSTVISFQKDSEKLLKEFSLVGKTSLM
ncbi:MAG: DUF7005 family protein [Ruminiclostridium sp.]